MGRILDALEEAGIADNTAIMFTSDNGGLATSEGSPTCNAPLAEGKGWMYEGGTREPLIVKWPGVTPGGVCLRCSGDEYRLLSDDTGNGGSGFDSRAALRWGEYRAFVEGDDLARDAIFWHFPHYGNQGGHLDLRFERGIIS